MLMLTRKPGESVILANNIRVTILAASGSSVKLGFEAPPDVSIYREELHQEIGEVNRAASDGSGELGADSDPNVV